MSEISAVTAIVFFYVNYVGCEYFTAVKFSMITFITSMNDVKPVTLDMQNKFFIQNAKMTFSFVIINIV